MTGPHGPVAAAGSGVIIGCGNIITDDGRYLLVREAKASARFRFNLPAGKPEVGETLIEAAIREAKEETGLDVMPAYLVGIYQCPQTSEGFGVVNFVFASTVTGGELRTSAAHPEVRYLSTEEIATKVGGGEIRGSHIALAIADYERGARLPLEIVHLVEPSPMPR